MNTETDFSFDIVQQDIPDYFDMKEQQQKDGTTGSLKITQPAAPTQTDSDSNEPVLTEAAKATAAAAAAALEKEKKQPTEVDDKWLDKQLEDKAKGKPPVTRSSDQQQDSDGDTGKSDDAPPETDEQVQAFYEDLIEEGIISEDEKFDGTIKGLFEITKNSIQAQAKTIVNEMFQTSFGDDNPNKETAVALLKHLHAGGSVETFTTVHKYTPFDTNLLASEDEDVRNKAAEDLIRKFYKSTGTLEEAEVNELIESAKESGTLAATAKPLTKSYNKLIEDRKKAQEALDEQQANNRVEDAAKFNTSLVDMIKNKAEINGLSIGKTAKEKQEVIDYFFTKSVTLENGAKVSPWVKDISSFQYKPEWVLFQGLALKNKLNLESAVSDKTKSAATTGVRKKLEEFLQQKKSSTPSAADAVSRTPQQNAMGLDFDNLAGSLI